MKRKARKRPAGQGTVWQRGGNWWVQWRESGRRRSAKFPTEDTARRVLARILGDLAAGRGGLEVEKAPSPPLATLAEAWLERRKLTVRSFRDDGSRWKCHLGPFFGRMLPDEVTPAEVRRFVESRLARGTSSTTAGHCVRLLSTLYTDLIERGLATANPVRALPRSTRRLYRSAHDPRSTAFLERQEDIAAVFRALPAPFHVVFAVGVLAGLRPGEVLALEWGDIDLTTRRIAVQRQVRHGRVGLPKSGKPRFVPVSDALAKILAEWRLATEGESQLFRPEHPEKGGRQGSPSRFLGGPTVQTKVRDALEACRLPRTLSVYQVTRHTYASQFVLGGGSIEKLQVILGHASVTTTQRYAHLRPDMLRPEDLPALRVDLSRAGGDVIDLASRRDERTEPRSNAVATQTVDESPGDDVSTHRL